jgi:polysaccharide biosynthesis transport protein
MDDLLDNHSAEKPVDWAERFHAYKYLARLLLRRYWWILFFGIVLGVAWQARKELSKKPYFVSNARMIISGIIDLPERDTYREQFTNFFGTQIALMNSPRVMSQARDRVIALNPELTPVHVDFNAYQQPETSLFRLTASGSEPRFVQAFLDAVMEEYVNFRREMRTQTSESTLIAITEQLIRLEEQIDEQENSVVDFQKANNLVFIKEQGSSAGSYLVDLKNQRADLLTQLHFLGSLGLDNLEDEEILDALENASLDLDSFNLGDSYQELRDQYFRTVAEQKEFAIYLKPAHPKMIRLNDEIERAGNRLRIAREQALGQIRQHEENLRRRLENLDSVITEWEETALRNSRLGAEFERLNARLERSRASYERLLTSIQSIDLNQRLANETVAVLEYATQPWEIKSSMTNKIIEGAMAGLFLGTGVLFLIGMLDNRIITADDLKNRFELPVLGVIPKEKLNKSGTLELLKPKDPRHLFAEACRTLRSSLLFLPPAPGRDDNQIFLITSSIPEEGKSTVATNLAIALAFTSSRTLLVDADLRRGYINKRFNYDRGPGLGDYLAGDTDHQSIIRDTPIENLNLVCAGENTERPGELLLSERMADALSRWRADFEFIIVDTAPILATDDTTGFSVNADCVLFVVRSAHTQQRQAKTSLDRLKQRRANLCGFILNGIDVKGTEYYYYSKYKDYYAYAPRT